MTKRQQDSHSFLVKLLVAWALVAAPILIWPLVPTSAKEWLASERGAAWAQALMSVGAIIVGALAIRWQVQAQRTIATQERNAQLAHELEELRDSLRGASSFCASTRTALEQAATNRPANTAMLMNQLAELLDDVRMVLDATDIKEIPGAGLRLGFVKARSAFGKVAAIPGAARPWTDQSIPLPDTQVFGWQADVSNAQSILDGVARQFDQHARRLRGAEQKPSGSAGASDDKRTGG